VQISLEIIAITFGEAAGSIQFINLEALRNIGGLKAAKGDGGEAAVPDSWMKGIWASEEMVKAGEPGQWRGGEWLGLRIWFYNGVHDVGGNCRKNRHFSSFFLSLVAAEVTRLKSYAEPAHFSIKSEPRYLGCYEFLEHALRESSSA
jgi:hypothetical protein